MKTLREQLREYISFNHLKEVRMIQLLTKKIYRKTLTSIVASIQPAISKSSLQAMVEHGVTIFRINFSWFEKARIEEWRRQIFEINEIVKQENLVMGVMLDTKGPEFRVHALADDAVPLEGRNQQGYIYEAHKDIVLTLDPNEKTNRQTIAVSAPEQTEFQDLGERVVFGDGDYEAEIQSRARDGRSMIIRPANTLCVWDLSKVNFPQTVVTASALSEEDKNIIKFFIDLSKDLDPRLNFMFAQSFIKSIDDVQRLKHFLEDTIKILRPIVIAKLETYECSIPDNLEKIVEAASAVMIARGDLANETSRQQVPKLQRQIIKVAKRFNKPVLLATQVYASMKDNNILNCTRPEAEDVRSALELGVDGFVLTGETTTRYEDPETVVEAVAYQIWQDEQDLIKEDEREPSKTNLYERLREIERKAFHNKMRDEMAGPTLPIKAQQWLGTTDFAIAAVFRANTYGAIGLFPFTQKGGTVREMSRFYPETEIYPITRSSEAALGLLLCRCTHPVLIDVTDQELDELYIDSFKDLVRKIVNDLGLRKRRPNARYAICTMAHPPYQPGGTDTLLRIRIDDLPK
jgi:pyruvate kinase